MRKELGRPAGTAWGEEDRWVSRILARFWAWSRWICTSSDLLRNLGLPHKEFEAPQLHMFGEEPVRGRRGNLLEAVRMMLSSHGPVLTEGSAGPQLSHVIVESLCAVISKAVSAQSMPMRLCSPWYSAWYSAHCWSSLQSSG